MKTKIPDTKPKRVNGTAIKTPLAAQPQPVQRRFMLIIQHEVIMYGEDEKKARANFLRTPFAKERTNLHITYAQEITNEERVTVFEDYRRAPGA